MDLLHGTDLRDFGTHRFKSKSARPRANKSGQLHRSESAILGPKGCISPRNFGGDRWLHAGTKTLPGP